jgi:hypothetical protein
MRGLVLMAVLATAMPAFAAEDSVPVADAAAPEAAPRPEAAPQEGAQTSEPTQAEAAPAADPELVEPEPALAPLSADAVARATFATAIDQREPVDSITSLESDRSRVYYFTELVGISGREVTHRWEYQGEVMAEVPIAIDGPRWRAYSSKSLDASRLGEWTVSVIDESGSVLRMDSFAYEAPAPVQEAAAPMPAPEVTSPEAMPAAPAAGESSTQAPASPAPVQP